MREAALAHLRPPVAVARVQLQALHGVGVAGRRRAPRAPGQRRLEDERRHLVERRAAQRPPRHPPEVHLVRRAGVQPVDAVAPVDEARAHQQHVVPGLGGQPAQKRRHQRARLGAQHLGGRDVAGVARVAGRTVRRVPQRVVVVRDGHDGAGAVEVEVGAPAGAQRLDDVAQEELQGVWALRGVGQVSHGERALERPRRQQGNGHGGFQEESGGVPRPRREAPIASRSAPGAAKRSSESSSGHAVPHDAAPRGHLTPAARPGRTSTTNPGRRVRAPRRRSPRAARRGGNAPGARAAGVSCGRWANGTARRQGAPRPRREEAKGANWCVDDRWAVVFAPQRPASSKRGRRSSRARPVVAWLGAGPAWEAMSGPRNGGAALTAADSRRGAPRRRRP